MIKHNIVECTIMKKDHPKFRIVVLPEKTVNINISTRNVIADIFVSLW